MTLTTQIQRETTEERLQPLPRFPITPEGPRRRWAVVINVGAVLAAAVAAAMVVPAITGDDGPADRAPEAVVAAPAPIAGVPSTATDPHHLHCMRSGSMVADRLQERVLRCREFSAHTTTCLAGVAPSPDVREAWISTCRDRAWDSLH